MSSNGEPRKPSDSWSDIWSALAVSVTEMLTTAGNTRLTSGAKLCCGSIVAGPGIAVVALLLAAAS